MNNNRLITLDAARYLKTKRITRLQIFKLFIGQRDFRTIYIYRKRHEHFIKHHKLRRVLFFLIDKLFGNKAVYIDTLAEVGGGLKIAHAFGIAIGQAKIGNNCTLRPNVTIGANVSRNTLETGYPTLGDNVWIAAGAAIIGRINVGDNVVIGANSVVCKNVQSDCIVAGVPAKIIGKYDNERWKD